jgi:hypothetical protein
MDTDLKKFIRGYRANHEKIPAQTVKVIFFLSFLYPPQWHARCLCECITHACLIRLIVRP